MFIRIFLTDPWRDRLRSRRSLEGLISSLVLLMLLLSLFVLTIRITEGGTWFDAVWLAWQTASTVGYGDIPPASTAGRIATIFEGLGLIVLLTNVLTLYFEARSEQKKLRRLGFMKNPHTGGYVLINFPGARMLQKFIEEIRARKEEADIARLIHSKTPNTFGVFVLYKKLKKVECSCAYDFYKKF